MGELATVENVASKRKPQAKLLRQAKPFSRDDLHLIRAALSAKRQYRDLALINLGIDTMLRSSDLLTLKRLDVEHRGEIVTDLRLAQQKTGGGVHCRITPKTQAALRTLIKAEDKWSGDYLFTRYGKPHGHHISSVQFRSLVKTWARYAHRNPADYSGHSLRRTKAAFIYQETRNPEIVRRLLGHGSLAATIHYLGVATQDALDVAAKYDI